MRKLNVTLGVCAAAGGLIALWSWQQLRVERAHTAALELELAGLQSRLDQASAPPPTAPSTPAPRSTPAPASPAGAQQQSGATDYLRAAARREREMLRDPAYREAQVAEGRRRFAQTRADTIRVVGMTPAQADRLIDLWVERNLRFTELGGVPGQAPGETLQGQLRRAAAAEQAELRALLGDAKYEEWNRYLASGAERAEVEQFRAQFSGTPDALRDAQADTLVKTIYSERQRRSREYDDYAAGAGIVDRNVVRPQDRQRWLDLEKEANQRIHQALTGTLSQAQLARLDEMLAARLVPVETALRMQLEGKLAQTP